MCASANRNTLEFTAAATSPMSKDGILASTAPRSYSRSLRRQATAKKSSLFILAIVVFTSTFLAAITPTTEAIPVVPLSDNNRSNEPSTYGCPAPELCIEHCKAIKSKGFCGEYPKRSCFCTL